MNTRNGKLTRAIGRLRRLARGALLASGALLLALFALCWTDRPVAVFRWLSMPEAVLDGDPEWIVVLGGRGIPSESGLVRTYYGAATAIRHPDARVIVALPGDESAPRDALFLMREELVLRGVERSRIRVEPRGGNTWLQAREIRRMPDGPVTDAPILLVTSPDHMRRSVMVFSRAGFSRVGGRPAFDAKIQGDLSIRDDEGAPPSAAAAAAAAVTDNLRVRYGFWNQAVYLTRSARELTALALYKIKGWI